MCVCVSISEQTGGMSVMNDDVLSNCAELAATLVLPYLIVLLIVCFLQRQCCSVTIERTHHLLQLCHCPGVCVCVCVCVYVCAYTS